MWQENFLALPGDRVVNGNVVFVVVCGRAVGIWISGAAVSNHPADFLVGGGSGIDTLDRI